MKKYFIATPFARKTMPLVVSFMSLLVILLISEHCKSNQAKTNAEGDCIINTAGVPEANGLEIEVYYPCSWFEAHVNEYPTVIKEVGDTVKNSHTNIGLVLMIRKLDTVSSETIDSLIKEIYLKGELMEEKGTISKDTIEINGVKGGEMMTRNVMESGQISYGLNIHLFFKNNLIQLRYVVGAPTESEAASAFVRYKPVFMQLAKRTKFDHRVP